MRMPAANICSPSLSFRKLVLRAIDSAIRGAGKMADERARDARIEHHRHALRSATLRGLSPPAPRARRRCGRSLLGRFEIGGVQRRGKS